MNENSELVETMSETCSSIMADSVETVPDSCTKYQSICDLTIESVSAYHCLDRPTCFVVDRLSILVVVVKSNMFWMLNLDYMTSFAEQCQACSGSYVHTKAQIPERT
jgi:hypothetical protein